MTADDATLDTAPPERRRNARGEGDRLRDQLLDATVALLSEEGDAARVSVRAIARAAGVSPTALYLQFPDRDALVAAAVDRGFEAFNDVIAGAAAAHEEPRARLHAMALAYLAFTEREPELYAVIFSTRRAKEAPAPVPEERQATREASFRVLLGAVGAAQPDLDETGVLELSIVLWSALHGFAMLRTRTHVTHWPSSEGYAQRLLDAHLGAAG